MRRRSPRELPSPSAGKQQRQDLSPGLGPPSTLTRHQDEEDALQPRSHQPCANRGGFTLVPALDWPELRALCQTCAWLIRSLQWAPGTHLTHEPGPVSGLRDLPTETRRAAPCRVGQGHNLPAWFPEPKEAGPGAGRWGRRGIPTPPTPEPKGQQRQSWGRD